MRILVTGGAGFIGSHIVEHYLEAGHEVAVLDNLSHGKRENLPPEVPLHEVDLRDAEAVAGVFGEFRPEVVNHQAAQASVAASVKQPVMDAQNNVLGMINLLEAARATDVHLIIYSSTGGAIYGDTDQIPTPESHPQRPLSPYGCSKLCGENYLGTYHRLYGLDYFVFRYANVYGPRQDAHGEGGVAIFAGQMLRGEQPTIFGKGAKTRDYVYVGDIAQASALALQASPNATLNLGTGVQTTDQEVYDAVAAAAGYGEMPHYGPERAGDLVHSCLDARLARQVLGWKAQFGFRDGVGITVAHLRSELAARGEI